MKERPILFSGPMVRAILDGRKSVTRRIVKLNAAGRAFRAGKNWHLGDPNAVQACPFGVPGDRLWVRETFCAWTGGMTDCGEEWDEVEGSLADYDPVTGEYGGCDIEYAADGKCEPRRWRPSIFMPRWASRLTLEVVSVRVERLQEITEEDAAKEGIEAPRCPKCGYTQWDCRFHLDHRICGEPEPFSAIPIFATAWDSLHGNGSWNANPWVWRIEFRRPSK